MPSSTTRLVEPISNAMAAVKLAPLRNSDRARATAAYEHDDAAAPSPAASARVRGRSSPRRATTVERRTTACTTAERAKPRINAQRISHVIVPASVSAWPIAASTAMNSSARSRPSGRPNIYPGGVSNQPRRAELAARGRGLRIAAPENGDSPRVPHS